MRVATKRYNDLEQRYQQLHDAHTKLEAAHKEVEAKYKRLVASAAEDSKKLFARVSDHSHLHLINLTLSFVPFHFVGNPSQSHYPKAFLPKSKLTSLTFPSVKTVPTTVLKTSLAC